MANPADKKKYVVVLAHADGWGAASANKVIKHIHQQYPDVGIYLIVSKATKDKEGRIATKIDDLRTPRALKETKLLEYFDHVDGVFDQLPTQAELNSALTSNMSEQERFDYFLNAGMLAGATSLASMHTFKQLGKQCCADGIVHYTSRGGPKGGEEVASIIEALEKQNGHGPEVLLSVDTMAILPEVLLSKYQCFSAHPGPLDSIRIEGMQGTLRSLANQVLYDEKGVPLPRDYVMGVGRAYIKGTLFMQHPELDKGPPIETVLTPVCPGMCAYQARDEVYHALTDAMLKQLPTLLNPQKRARLVKKVTKQKERLDAQPHIKIDELDAEKFATWQSSCVGFANGAGPWGVEVFQNEIISPDYFRNQMRRFFPGVPDKFMAAYHEIFGGELDRLAAQKDKHLLEDPWAALMSGRPNIKITQCDPKTHKPRVTYKNDADGNPSITRHRGDTPSKR